MKVYKTNIYSTFLSGMRCVCKQDMTSKWPPLPDIADHIHQSQPGPISPHDGWLLKSSLTSLFWADESRESEPISKLSSHTWKDNLSQDFQHILFIPSARRWADVQQNECCRTLSSVSSTSVKPIQNWSHIRQHLGPTQNFRAKFLAQFWICL